jgi:predicted RNase H-like HicB family nuclease
MKYNFTYIIEKSKTGYSAYVPDLPGCIAAAKTVGLVKRLIAGAIKMHIETMLEDGDKIPVPTSKSYELKIEIAA